MPGRENLNPANGGEAMLYHEQALPAFMSVPLSEEELNNMQLTGGQWNALRQRSNADAGTTAAILRYRNRLASNRQGEQEAELPMPETPVFFSLSKKERRKLDKEHRKAYDRAYRANLKNQSAYAQRAGRAELDALQAEDKMVMHKRFLLEDPKVRKAYDKARAERDSRKKLDRILEFLDLAADTLLADDVHGPMLEEDYPLPVNLTSAVQAYKLAIAEQAGEGVKTDKILRKLDEQEEIFREMAEANVRNRIICLAIPDMFEHDFGNDGLLRRAYFRISEEFDRKSNSILKEWQEYELTIPKMLGIHIPERSLEEARFLPAFQEKVSRIKQRFSTLPQEEAEKQALKAYNDEQKALTGPGKMFSYAAKAEKIRLFNDRIKEQELLHPELTRHEIEGIVLQRFREEFRQGEPKEALAEKSIELSRRSSVVSRADGDQWKEHGGASYHMYYPLVEAEMLVRDSRGFLCAKPVPGEPFLRELRPSLPERVTIGNGAERREIELRKVYNLMIKCLARSILDEYGNFRSGEMQYTQNGRARTMDMSAQATADAFYDVTVSKACDAATAEEFCMRRMYAEAKKLVGDKEAFRLCSDMKLMLTSFSGQFGTFLRSEVAEAPLGFISKGAAFRQKPLAERLAECEAEFRQQNNLPEGLLPKDLADTLKLKQDAIKALASDQTLAVNAMLELRVMDIDDEEIPVPNACSGNAVFIQNMKAFCLGETEQYLFYQLQSGLNEKPKETLNYISDHLDALLKTRKWTDNERQILEERLPRLKDNPVLTSENIQKVKELSHQLFVNRETLNKLRSKLEATDLPEEEKQRLEAQRAEKEAQNAALEEEMAPFREPVEKFLEICGYFKKYDFHAAANILSMENRHITTEGFAAETHQLMVAPFTFHSAIGDYRGGDTALLDSLINAGMESYYNQDNALPNDLEAEKVAYRAAKLGVSAR